MAFPAVFYQGKAGLSKERRPVPSAPLLVITHTQTPLPPVMRPQDKAVIATMQHPVPLREAVLRRLSSLGSPIGRPLRANLCKGMWMVVSVNG